MIIKKAIMENIPMKAFGETEDIANAVAFLASEEARYITGQVISVDGRHGYVVKTAFAVSLHRQSGKNRTGVKHNEYKSSSNRYGRYYPNWK